MHLPTPQTAHPHGYAVHPPSSPLFASARRFARGFRSCALAALGCAALAGAAQQAYAQTWNLVWSDEFNGATNALPDSGKWTYDTGGGGFGNGELETYCSPSYTTAPCVAGKPNAYQDGNGNLVIQARRDSSGAWTSARLKTQGIYQFQYGRVEARMKLQVGDGLWPAFWMLGANINQVGWPQTGEDDIMEWVQSYGPSTTSSTTHGPGYSGGNGIGARYTFPNGQRVDDGNYHIYGLIWSQNLLQYYRDSTSNIFLTITPSSIPAGTQWVYNNPFFILLNFAIGSGGFPGATDSSTPSTANTLVDYVRVYQAAAGGGGGSTNLNGTHVLAPGNAQGLVLDDQSASTAGGNPIDIYAANGTGAQKWVLSNTNVQPAGYYNIASSLGSFCATATGGSGSVVNLQPCNGSSGQAWQAVASGSGYTFHPASNTGLCLDVRSAGTTNGTLVQTWTCNSTSAQTWSLQ